MYKYSISMGLFFLLVLGSFCPTANAQEDACSPVEWISEIEGIILSSTEMKAGKCERVYVFSNDVDLVFNRIRRGFEDRGWNIEEDTEINIPGLESRMLKAVHGSMAAEIATRQDSGGTKLAVELRGSESDISEKQSGIEGGASSLSLSLPVPDGCTLISETRDDEDYVLTYSYTGDMGKAVSWISSELKKQGWEVDDDSSASTSFGLGATIEAEKGGYDLDISFSGTSMSGTIVYTLSQ